MADRAVVRERQAIPGGQGRARHRAIDSAALGPGHPRQWLHPGRGQPHVRAGRAGRAEEMRPAVGGGGGRFRTSGAGIRAKAGVIRANAARCPISAQCGIPGVPRSTYYRMIEHPETERADPIAGDVRAAWRDGRERYGARKIKAAPERRGVTASSRRIGNIMREHEQAAEEGARVPEPLHHDRAAEARPQRLRVAVRQPAAPLHPRIPEPEGIHRTRTRPLRNCPTHRCQSIHDLVPGQEDQDRIRHGYHGPVMRARPCGIIRRTGTRKSNKTARFALG